MCVCEREREREGERERIPTEWILFLTLRQPRMVTSGRERLKGREGWAGAGGVGVLRERDSY